MFLDHLPYPLMRVTAARIDLFFGDNDTWKRACILDDIRHVHDIADVDTASADHDTNPWFVSVEWYLIWIFFFGHECAARAREHRSCLGCRAACVRHRVRNVFRTLYGT